MDPNQTLTDLRSKAFRLLRASERAQANDQSPSFSEEDVLALVEGVIALDEWLVKGGFLPQDWNQK
jgi:hypothetical protein